MLSCFGGDRDSDEAERQPLLPRYNDETSRQAKLRQKLHTYQMIRAITNGYMPSTDQSIEHVKSLSSSQIFNQQNVRDLSGSGQALVSASREWLRLFIELLNEKNSQDRIQNFIWYLTEQLKSGRKDGSDLAALKATDGQETKTKGGSKSEHNKPSEIQETVRTQAAEAANTVATSVQEHTGQDTQEILINRLKKAVASLRQRKDYSEAVSQLTQFLQRCASICFTAASETAEQVQGSVEFNEGAKAAATNIREFISSFGDEQEWNNVSKKFQEIIDKNKESGGSTEELVQEMIQVVQSVLSDPDFLSNFEQKTDQVKEEFKHLTQESSLPNEISEFLHALHAALASAAEDKSLQGLVKTSSRIGEILVSDGRGGDSDILSDLTSGFLPVIIGAVQYFPIPRLEVATEGVDLLLENLILEPGKTMKNSSFFPYNVHICSKNDLDIAKERFGTTSSMTNLVTINILGMSIAAEDMGFWMRVHSGLLRFMDEGFAGFHLDERGIDISMDLEIGRDRIEELVVLRRSEVKVHRLNYQLQKSKFACLAWLLKPLLRVILRKALQSAISSAIANGIKSLNRELVFARERLRAARICNPDSLWTFIQAVSSRVSGDDHDDKTSSVRAGFKPGDEVFKGRYAPGSLVKVWEQEAEDARNIVHEYSQDGWRDDIFNIWA